MDHDVLTANDFGGEAFLSLRSIPGVADYNTTVENFHGLKQIELPLMQQCDKSKYHQGYLKCYLFTFVFSIINSYHMIIITLYFILRPIESREQYIYTETIYIYTRNYVSFIYQMKLDAKINEVIK